MSNLHTFDFIIAFIYLIAGYPILFYFFKDNFTEAVKAYTFKAVIAYGFCLVYIYYYEGGDTYLYWRGSGPFVKLLLENPINLIKVLIEKPSITNYYYFNDSTGYPSHDVYYRNDMVVILMFKIVFFFRLFSFENYISTTILLCIFSFVISFKFYEFIVKKYSGKYYKYAILYVPSVAFWGSGILKDTFTFSATLLIIYSLMVISKRGVIFKYIFMLFVGLWLIISIKPYIFLALLPAKASWLILTKMKSIRFIFLRILLIPIFLIISIIGLGFVWSSLSPFLGAYGSSDSISKKAHSSYSDLKQDYYGGNSFDIGDYDASIQGMLSKFLPATIAGLFRPFIWESKSITMLLSGIENLIIFILTIYVLATTRLHFFKYVTSDPFVLFCLIFSIIMSFSIAISTSNFGALVRFKIPLIPFYLLMLLIVLEKHNKTRKLRLQQSILPR